MFVLLCAFKVFVAKLICMIFLKVWLGRKRGPVDLWLTFGELYDSGANGNLCRNNIWHQGFVIWRCSWSGWPLMTSQKHLLISLKWQRHKQKRFGRTNVCHKSCFMSYSLRFFYNNGALALERWCRNQTGFALYLWEVCWFAAGRRRQGIKISIESQNKLLCICFSVL